MQEFPVRSIQELMDVYRTCFPDSQPERDSEGYSQVLFRGQSNADWRLRTTLERFSDHEFSVGKYHNIVLRLQSRFALYTGNGLLPDCRIARTWENLATQPELLELIIQLRHFGFPSPLLDWTESPYLAAYFAYRDAGTDGDVAVYAFCELVGRYKTRGNAQANIHVLNMDVRAHRRHHIQQAQYTLCLATDDEQSIFRCHEDTFSREEKYQDQLLKFVLPIEKRDIILRDLQAMNINDHTLFGNEEGLCRSLAQELIPRQK